MGISETQLETWSHIGAIQGSSSTYATIKNTLETPTSSYSDKPYKIFLQGSYGNSTNIWSESDVDIVINLESCYQSDLTLLSPEQIAAWTNANTDATYTFVDFKKDVLKVLTDAYGSDVKSGDKAITIEASGNRRKADVITAINFRRYSDFKGIYDESYAKGICFYNKAGERIANYPKQHSENLTKKHQATSLWLKPMIRILKNLRSKLVDDGLLGVGVAPSYYLEGLLYNVPNEKFGTSYVDTFVNAMNWIQKDADKTKLVCANEQYYLLRDNAKTCWRKADGEALLNSAITYWNNC